jgi:ubiquinone/menaquinone biosynthesis C-methylase UbiE
VNGTVFNGFDRLAPIYDSLARMIYGKSIVQAQTCFLGIIPPLSKVLILGGGTGWLLTELLRDHPTCEVWYIESSANMLSMAIKKSGNPNQVHFILGTEEDIPAYARRRRDSERGPTCGFDIVITHFFLDLFAPLTLQRVVQKISLASKPSALWVVADFVDRNKWWQLCLLKVMYSFFSRACRIEARTLPPWGGVLVQSGLRMVQRRLYYAGFIESAVYRLPLR